MRKEFQPFKFSQNEDIAGLAKNINTNLTKLRFEQLYDDTVDYIVYSI